MSQVRVIAAVRMSPFSPLVRTGAETVGPGNTKVVCILPLDQSRWRLSSQASDHGENSPHCRAFQGGRLGGTGRAVTGGYSERHLFAMSQQKLIVQRKAV